ncbi:MAG: hypothetical protein WCK41_08200 [Actinomycetes bacterium]
MNEDSEPRYRAIHVQISQEAHETWMSVTDEYGVTMAGILEAVGHDFSQPKDDRLLGSRLPDLIERARGIDADRRRRPGRGSKTS